MSKNKYDESSTQAWPSFVDILSSTVLVLAFALLVLVIVLSITRITSSIRKQSYETSPSSFKVESEVLGEYRAEFQKLVIIANPSLRKEMEIQSDAPTVEREDQRPVYVPEDITDIVENPQDVKEIGDSQKQVLGDMPKIAEVNPIEVLEELIIVQKDVIEQQRKVIEQQDEEIVDAVREYQSLLALITKENEVEDIRQKIAPKPDVAKFVQTDIDGQKIQGNVETPSGEGSLFLSPPNNPNAKVLVREMDQILIFDFNDNAPFLNNESAKAATAAIRNNIENYKEANIILEAKVTDYAVSSAEAQRIAVERLLIFRSLLIDAGVSPSLIRLKTIDNTEEASYLVDDERNAEELNYGWVAIKRNE